MSDPTPYTRRSPLEHERDVCPLGDDCDLTTAWMAGALDARRKMEADLNTAIAAAYEVAARAADPAQMTCLDAYDEGRLDAADDIRAMIPAAALAARDADRARVRREAWLECADWIEPQRNDRPANGSEFAAAIRAMIEEEGNG